MFVRLLVLASVAVTTSAVGLGAAGQSAATQADPRECVQVFLPNGQPLPKVCVPGIVFPPV